MREMKDSGIEWIGKIPKDWERARLKDYFCFEKGKNAQMYTIEYIGRNEGIYPVYSGQTENNGVMGKINKYDYDVDECLFTTTVGAKAMTPKYLTGKFCLSQNCLIMQPTKYSSVKYFYYMLHPLFDYQKSNIPAYMQPSLRMEDLEKMVCCLPNLMNQKIIADFLDTQCSEIDATAEDIQKEISLLEDYKKSVITEAVTKGLNPDAEMKDSGVKWIGEIPVNWQAVNPRWLFAQRKDRAKKGMEQYTASQKYGVISQKDYMNRIGGSIVTVQKDFDILKMVCEGDFVIHMRSFQGGLEYSEHTGSISSAYVMLIPQKNTGECRYFKWLFKSASYINALQSTSNLIRDGQAMRYSNFIQIIIPYPPLDEQQQIADFLDTKCSEIDAIIADKKRQRDILADYKKSLIYEYVTGKKEVPINE